MAILMALSSCNNKSDDISTTDPVIDKQDSINIVDNKEVIRKAKESLKFEAETTNKLLVGEKIDAMTRVVSVDFDGTNFVYTYEINEDYTTIDEMRANKETIEKNIRNNIDKTPQIEGLKENLIKIKGNFVYNYVGSKSIKVLTIIIEL